MSFQPASHALYALFCCPWSNSDAGTRHCLSMVLREVYEPPAAETFDIAREAMSDSRSPHKSLFE